MNKTSINQVRDKTIPTKKAIIKTTDMPDEMQEDACYFAALGTVVWRKFMALKQKILCSTPFQISINVFTFYLRFNNSLRFL